MGLVVAVDDPRADDVRDLLIVHLSFSREVTPVGHVHALSVAAMSDPAVTLVSAREDGSLLGVGALKELDTCHGELKSMHVRDQARRKGVGRALVDFLVDLATRRNYRWLGLETGTMQLFAPARSLYSQAGFRPCEPFGEYSSNPFSTCMSIELG